eukprot:2111885-Rhodomonas_salina.1
MRDVSVDRPLEQYCAGSRNSTIRFVSTGYCIAHTSCQYRASQPARRQTAPYGMSVPGIA